MNCFMENDKFSMLASGEWTDGFDDEFARVLSECRERCFMLNSLPPSRTDERTGILKSLLGAIGSNFSIQSPFYCDFGFNISIGDNFVSNYNLTILDEARVTIGDNVFIGPGSTICTITHALDAPRRNIGVMRALPVTIGDNVWIASGVTILPGVSIGPGAVIGAGSVVTKSVPAGVLAAGNPCRMVREI